MNKHLKDIGLAGLYAAGGAAVEEINHEATILFGHKAWFPIVAAACGYLVHVFGGREKAEEAKIGGRS